MYLMSRVHKAGLPVGQPSCVAKPLIMDITCKLLSQIFSYHFVPFLMTLTLPVGHEVSAKQTLLASFSPTLFI